MGVDFYNCGGCGEIHSDCEPLHMCSYCESYVFDCCYEEMVKKYGKVEDEKLKSRCGEDALKRCNRCSDVEEEVKSVVKIRRSEEGDWEELWINGEKKLENHKLKIVEVLKKLKEIGIGIEIEEEKFKGD